MGKRDNKVNASGQKGSEDTKLPESQSAPAEGKGRIDRLETDLEDLKTTVEGSSVEVKRAVGDLEKAVVDIRSAVSEIENPFNLLRVITNEKDIGRIKAAQPAIGHAVRRERDEAEIEEPRPAETGELREPVSLLTFKHGTSLVRWIYAMLDLGFDERALKGICDYCEYIGLIPTGSRPHLSNMIDTISSLNSKGLFEEEVIVSMYTVAEATEVKVEGYRVGEALIRLLGRNKSKRMVG